MRDQLNCIKGEWWQDLEILDDPMSELVSATYPRNKTFGLGWIP